MKKKRCSERFKATNITKKERDKSMFLPYLFAKCREPNVSPTTTWLPVGDHATHVGLLGNLKEVCCNEGT
jgi:hypothetical protein